MQNISFSNLFDTENDHEFDFIDEYVQFVMTDSIQTSINSFPMTNVSFDSTSLIELYSSY